MNIIPAINGKCELTTQKIALPQSITITQGFNAQTEVFCTRMKQLGVDVNAGKSPFITFGQSNNFKAEEYTLSISQSAIAIEFGGEGGLNNGLITLYQLAMQGGLCCGYIHDYPKYSFRGVHLDTARHFFEVAEIEKIIEQISLLKINHLHWHFADDQGWRLEIKAFPLLTNYCGKQCYTQADAAHIVAYAAKRGVQVIPEFEIPSHSTAAIAAYPSLSCRNAKVKPPIEGGIYKIIMCAGKDETLGFIENVIYELCQLFTGEYFHIGGDEAPKKEWKACPHCNAKLKQLGLSTFEQLQGYLLNYANTILQKHGKKVICWNDSLKADNLNKDIIVQYWQHKNKAEIKSTQKLIFSNVRTLYFDYPCCVSNLKNVYNYIPKVKGKTPNEQSILGVECALWAERIATNAQLEHMLFPRVVALAENAWTNSRDYNNFIKRLSTYYQQLDKAKINAASLKNAQVSGFKRIWGLAKFSGTMIKAFACLLLPQKVEY